MVRIRQEAYPLRIGFSEMCRRFRCLVAFKPGKKTTPEACSDREAREMCPEICLAALEPGEFQMGKTKIFLKWVGGWLRPYSTVRLGQYLIVDC